ncbi:hypothetical protein FGIG_09839 [Fasciola gigantica]|uniref:EF-hand domain-containing protein n=1 Tax=Fasciola gigantica TaxID=46835 RepID=A0A504YR05_FASGI|nr:hypothetical protein FGIG_09839 [Fasciola gigantica]
MDYLNQFTQIDTNRDGLITRRELFKYALSIGEDISMVDTWFRLFDSQDKGVITIEDVSRTLGVPPPKYYKERMNRRQVGDRTDYVFQSAPNLNENDSIDQYDFEQSLSGTLPKWRSEEHCDGANELSTLTYITKEINPDEDPETKSVKQQVTRVIHDGLDANVKESVLASQIGKTLEQQYGRIWHVHVSQKTIGCAFSHLPGRLIQLRSRGHFVVAYQTLAD